MFILLIVLICSFDHCKRVYVNYGIWNRIWNGIAICGYRNESTSQ